MNTTRKAMAAGQPILGLQVAAVDQLPPSPLHSPPHSPPQPRVWRGWGWAETALLAVTLIWGTTFVAVQSALASWPPFVLIAMRFSIATIVLVPGLVVGGRRVRGAEPASTPPRLGQPHVLRPSRPSRADVLGGVLLGVLLFAGYALQTESLVFTTAARSAFFTALFAVLVPLLGRVISRKPLALTTILATMAAAGGVVALLGGGLAGAVLGAGDALAASCAVAFAGNILAAASVTRRARVARLAVIQVATTAVLAWGAAAALGESVPRAQSPGWSVVVYLGVVATAVALGLQLVGQRHTSANRAAFIFALEPVFAALFASALGSQTLAAAEWAGGGLIAFAAAIADRPLPAWASRVRARRGTVVTM